MKTLNPIGHAPAYDLKNQYVISILNMIRSTARKIYFSIIPVFLEFTHFIGCFRIVFSFFYRP